MWFLEDGLQGALELRKKVLEGPVIKTLLWLAWPVIVANLVNMSYNLIDALWLGRLGKEAFGAPTISWPLITLLYSIGMGYMMAGIALISQYFGAGEKHMAEKSAGYLFGFSLILATLMSITGYVAAPSLLAAINTPEDIYPLALSYIRIIFLGIPITFLGFIFNIVANAIGDTRTPTWLNIISAIINIILDPILIFGLFGLPRLGVVGAAVATITSRSLVSFIGGYKLFKGFKGIKINPRYLIPEKWWLRKIFTIGTPLAVQRSSTSLGFTVMMSIVSRYGSVAVAAYGISIRIIDIIQAFTLGINRATSIMIGQNIGAEKYERSREIAHKSIILIVTILTIGALIIYLFSKQIITVFINDPYVVSEGTSLLRIFTLSIPFFGIFFITSGIANGSGHTRAVAIISIIRLWILRIGLSIVLAIILKMNTTGIWLAMSISNIVAGILSITWLSRGTWLKRVVEVPRIERLTEG